MKLPFGVVVVGRHGQPLLRFGRTPDHDRPSGAPDPQPLPAAAVDIDNLTQLPGRGPMLAALTREFELVRRGGPDGCVAFLDLDDFKVVNDAYGHRKGDELLQVVAQSLQEQVRSADLVARTGGDEFVVVLPQTGLDEAVRMLQRVNRGLDRWVTARLDLGQTAAVTASIGVTNIGRPARTPTDLLAYANAAMYAAKVRQRGDVAVARKGITDDLRRQWAELAAAAATDQPTGLLNKTSFHHDWTQLHDRAQRDGHPYGLVLIDIDHFHAYNRAHGLLAGDAALRAVAQTVNDHTLDDEVAYRYGGEEFAVLLTGMHDRRSVDAVGSRTVAAVRNLRLPHADRPDGGTIVTVTAAGILVDPRTDGRISAFHQLDATLTRGKALGRNRYLPVTG